MDNIIPQDAPQKQCTKCKKWKSATLVYFVSNSRVHSHIGAECKECINAQHRQKYALKHPATSIHKGYKHCPKCENDYPATPEYFGTDKCAKDKLTSRCKTCKNAAQKLRKRRSSPKKAYQFNPDIVAYKHCCECKQEKLVSLENFRPDKYNTFGVSRVCRNCWKSYIERLAKEQATKQQKAIRTCVGPCGRTLPATTEFFPYAFYGVRNKCKDCRREEYRTNYKLNEETRKARRREYVDAHRESVRAYDRNRNAWKKNSIGQHTAEDVKLQYERQKGKCYWCSKKLGTGRRAFHVDHVVPLARGGSNDPSNLVIACPYCNQSKQDKLPHEWPAGGRLL